MLQPSPWRLRTGGHIEVKAGEPIEFTLKNPDVVPHNWVLVKPGTLERTGEQSNRMISDPEAAIRHYVPASTDVIAHTDIVWPANSFTIYFKAPSQPGRAGRQTRLLDPRARSGIARPLRVASSTRFQPRRLNQPLAQRSRHILAHGSLDGSCRVTWVPLQRDPVHFLGARVHAHRELQALFTKF